MTDTEIYDYTVQTLEPHLVDGVANGSHDRPSPKTLVIELELSDRDRKYVAPAGGGFSIRSNVEALASALAKRTNGSGVRLKLATT